MNVSILGLEEGLADALLERPAIAAIFNGDEGVGDIEVVGDLIPVGASSPSVSPDGVVIRTEGMEIGDDLGFPGLPWIAGLEGAERDEVIGDEGGLPC